MTHRLASLWRSMPLRLALGLVLVFSLVSLVSYAATYLVTQRSMEQTMREDLRQSMVGFRAAPGPAAVAALVQAQARGTDPQRLVLSYVGPNRKKYGNAAIARDGEGYHVVSLGGDGEQVQGRYLALTAPLYGGQLTIARSREQIDRLGSMFRTILGLSLVPTLLIACSAGLYLARRSARQVGAVGRVLDRLTSGDLGARVAPGKGWTDDLAEIGAKIDQMARAQEASVASLRQVSSDIAHDLKTPIQRVAVHLDELARAPDLPAVSRAEVEAAQEELDGIVSVFHALLQIAQIEAGTPKSQFEPLDLSDLVATCVELYEPAAAESGHRLSARPAPADLPQITGARSLLLQMLSNLVENALRHTPEGSEVILRLNRQGKRVLLEVADTGPGIPSEEQEKVLQRLYRLDRSRNTPGSGLGLSLVAVVAKLHGAELSLGDAAPGLRVTLSFPAA